jgi:cell division protein FtsW (lipid II flippase)
VLAALIACLAAAAARPARLWAAGVMVLAVVWPLVNQPIEGPTLWVVAPQHGLTVSDLLALVCFIMGAWLLRRALMASRIASRGSSVHLDEHRENG